MRRYAPLIIIILLAACASITPNEVGRHPVELMVVDQLWCFTVPDCFGQVVSANKIRMLRGYHTNTTLVAHELVHTVQWRELGRVGFLITYAKQFVAYGYDNMPLEVQARELAAHPWYQAWAMDLIATLEN